MPPVHIGPVVGLLGQSALLAALAGTIGLTTSGWVVGVLCALVTAALVARGMSTFGIDRLGPADRITLTRLVLAGGVAALVGDRGTRPGEVSALVSLSVVALLLDAVDGQVARRTHTASAFGARFDGESDAFLILVLSVHVAPAVGGWVLAIGAARYAFLAAGLLRPWLRGELPPRHWRKVVAAVQGVALTIVASGVLPGAWAGALLVVSLLLLAESFGRDVVWLWLRREGPVRSSTRLRAGSTAAPTVAPGG